MKKKRSLKKYMGGTGAEGVKDTQASGAMGGGMMGIYQQIPGILDAIIGLAENNPKAYSKQPTVNGNVMRNMVSPYGFGGEVDEFDEEQLQQLQQMADDNGITIEELIVQLKQESAPEEDPDVEEESPEEDAIPEEENDPLFTQNEFGFGGTIDDTPRRRKKNNRLLTTNYGYNGIVNEQGQPVDNPTYDEALMTMIKFMGNNNSDQLEPNPNSKQVPSNNYKLQFQHHSIAGPKKPVTVAAFGGTMGNVSVNVEGDEVLETPNGNIAQMSGPSHEQGGIDVEVPKGTKVFSTRLQVEGKTMEQRKLSRERVEKRLQRLQEKNPNDKILQNTIKRTLETNAVEEQKDMAIQKAVNTIANMGVMAQSPKKTAAYGDIIDEQYDTEDPFGIGAMVLKYGNKTLPVSQGVSPYKVEPTPIKTKAATPTNITVPDAVKNYQRTSDSRYFKPKKGKKGEDGLGIGDVTGIAGNLFNAVAPILNTISAAENTPPNRNRYRGFGTKALESNDTAQAIAAKTASTGKTNASITANSGYMRNRNSARSLNTIRGLDIATDLVKDKAEGAVENTFASTMINLLGNRANLQNQKDKVEMAGESAVDKANKDDIDNYYTNMAENIVNAGTNVQGVGKALNTARSNKTDRILINQLSRYGLGFDEDGNLITIKS